MNIRYPIYEGVYRILTKQQDRTLESGAPKSRLPAVLRQQGR